MKTGALYYPFHPDDGEWLRHALLYFDFVGTTVPSPLENALDEYELPKHLRGLRDEGQYVAVIDDLPLRPLMEYLGSIDRAFEFALIHGAEDFALGWFMDPNMHVTDQTTGESFQMVDFLVEAVANFSSDVHVPSTDKEKRYEIHYGHNQGELSKNPINSLSIAYNNVLPAPASDTPLKKIISFKQRYSDELLRLRSAIAEVRKCIGNCESTQELNIVIAERKNELASSVADTKRALGSNNITVIGSFIKELISVKAPFVTSAAALVAGGGVASLTARSLTTVSMATLIGGATVSATVAVGAGIANAVSRRSETLRSNPYAYLYLAEKKLGAVR